MGAWGPGLYSSDMALDLKPMVKTLLRLPLSAAEIVAKLVDAHEPARNPLDEDHTTFWLVLADQFSRAGLYSEEVVSRAVEIIDTGKDNAMMAELGMAASDLRKRAGSLAKLRASIMAAGQKDTRKIKAVSAPAPLLFSRGDVFVYPTQENRTRNPYLPWPRQPQSWKADGWHAGVVLLAERAFGHLPWYGVLTTVDGFSEKPDLERALSAPVAYIWTVGIMRKRTMDMLGIEIVGRTGVHESHLDDTATCFKLGAEFAASDTIMDLKNRAYATDRRTIASIGLPDG